MPNKRALAQTDANAILPPKKKSKEKNVIPGDEYESKTKEDLVEMLKGKSMSSNGTKEMLIRRLKENEVPVAPKASEKTERRKSARIEAADHDAKILENREEVLKSAWTVKNKPLVASNASTNKKSSAASSRNKAPAPQQSTNGYRLDYRSKDNSKLRALLRDWRVMESEEVESMDRMAMIERLERHEMRGYGDDYESLTCDQLFNVSVARLLPAIGGSKAVRIERLRNDDAVDRDRGNLEEGRLYLDLVGYQNQIQQYQLLMDWVRNESKTYQDLGVSDLRCLMDLRQEGRKVKCVCGDSDLVDWLEADDEKMARKSKVKVDTFRKNQESVIAAKLDYWKDKFDHTRIDLETNIGHPLPATISIQEPSKDKKPVNPKTASSLLVQPSCDEGNSGRDMNLSLIAGPSTIGTAPMNESIYAEKDNSMLRTLLRDRRLQISGTREEMIHRLDASPYNYESYSSEELSLILKNRHLTNADVGNKELKIERIKNSDEAIYDSANSEDTKLYVDLELKEGCIKVEEQALKALTDPSASYENLESRALIGLASALGLSTRGGDGAVIKRLQANDQKLHSEGKDKTILRDAIEKLTASLKAHKEKCNEARKRLEMSVGHPVQDVAELMKRYSTIFNRDYQTVYNYQPTHKPGPLCDYDWKKSHWAGRSERELREICHRQGMEGTGTKATCIKWLETGSVEYEELWGLDMLCWERGIKVKPNERRLDLARKLREADEREGVYRDLGIMALRKMCKERGINVRSSEPKQELVTKLRVADEKVGRV